MEVRVVAWAWTAWLACDGGGPPDPVHSAEADHTGTTATSVGFCGVRGVFRAECVRCHDAEGRQGGLDLASDPYAALVGVTSATYDEVLVTPGDPAASLLLRKMEGLQAVAEGGVMPPGGRLDPAVEVVRAWITDGATASCDEPTTTTPTSTTHHPAGYADPGIHGIATKFQQDPDCRACHGADLSGGDSGVSCDSCHRTGWRADCTYCHGGTSSTSGAPPEDLDDNADRSTTTFPPHDVHEAGERSPAYRCEQCHPTTTGLFDGGHVFDDPTPGEAEVELPNGVWEGRTCSDTWCHGNGRAPGGAVSSGAGARTCGSCHAGGLGTEVPFTSMSGAHVQHLTALVACDQCHPTVSGSDTITAPGLHVQGVVDLAFPPLLVRDEAAGSCTGSCHGHVHLAAPW
jgi:hypothetical protein